MKFTTSCRERIPESWQRYIVFVGCILLNMPVSLTYYFGNLLIYIYSYYFSSASTYLLWVDPLWVSSAFQMSVPVGMVLAGLVERRFSLRVGLLVGASLMSLSVILSYYSIVHPLGLLVTFGIIQGLGGGFVQSLANKLATQCLLDRPGLSFGLMSSGQSSFCLLHSVMSFRLINPENLTTNAVKNNINYFTQTDVVEYIPGVFMKIGFVTCVIQTLGFVFVLAKSDEGASFEICIKASTDALLDEGSARVESQDKTETEFCKTLGGEVPINGNGIHYGSLEESSDINLNTVSVTEETKEGCNENLSDENSKNRAPVVNGHCFSTADSESPTYQSTHNNAETRSGDITSNQDLSPTEVLTSYLFWKVWVMFFLARHTIFLQMSFYKEYGLTVIANDNMLVVAASLGAISMTFVRPLCGILADYLDFKTLLLCVFVFTNVCITMLPLTLHTFPPLYIVFSVVGFCSSSFVSVCHYLIPIALFGPTHYASNVGIFCTTFMIVCFMEPFLMPIIIKNCGWIYVFLTGSVSSTVAVFVTLFLFPRWHKRKDPKNNVNK